MKTIRKKNQSLEFVLLQDYEIKKLLAPYLGETDLISISSGETLAVKVGQDHVAFVTVVSRQDGDWEELTITQLYVLPEYQNFGIGTQILEALSEWEGVAFVRVIATPDSAPFYEDRGFERDAGHIVLTKVI